MIDPLYTDQTEMPMLNVSHAFEGMDRWNTSLMVGEKVCRRDNFVTAEKFKYPQWLVMSTSPIVNVANWMFPSQIC